MTEEKAKKTPAGGVLVGKREGQTIIHDKGTQGGYFVGKLHKEGGIKGINKSTGQPIEVQGGEVIITAPAVADQTKREFEGEMLTNREILSKINERGGGVSLENGGEIYYNGSSYNYGGKTMTDYEIMQEISNCGCEHKYNHGGLSKGKSLQDIADMHNVSLSSIKKELAKGKKVESEHTSDKKLAEKIAKDHLVENPKYYTILDKVGLSDGGEIENLIKEGKIDLKFYETTPSHAREYGIECENPIYIQTLHITKENRLNGLGKKTLKYLEDYCKKNGNDVIFGKINNNVEFTKDERTNYLSDVELMKYWLHDNGYAVNDDNNDFHKVVNVRYNQIENNKKFINWFVGWYKDAVYKKMNIIMSIPFFDYNYGVDNVNKNNVVVLDIFEKKDQKIDAKKYLKEICDKADDYGVIIFLEPEPRFNYIQDNESKKQKITKEYLINYYSKFDFEKIKNKEFLIRLPKNKNKIFNNGGQLDLVKESKKGDHPARDLNNYNDLMDVEADGMVGAENGLAFADGGDLDFLDDAVSYFTNGGGITNEVDAIELSEGSSSYWGTMPKTQYNSFNEFLSDLQTAFINKEKRGGYFYFWVLKDGFRINSVKLAIQFKNGKNTVLNLNPLTAKSSDFLKQIERRYINTIKRNNLDFSKWLTGKSSSKTTTSTTQSQPTTNVVPLIDLSNTKIWIGGNEELNRKIQKKAFELGWKWSAHGKTFNFPYTNSLFFTSDEEILKSEEDRPHFNTYVSFTEIFPEDLFGSASQATSSFDVMSLTKERIDLLFDILQYKNKNNLQIFPANIVSGNSNTISFVDLGSGDVFEFNVEETQGGGKGLYPINEKSSKLAFDFIEYEKQLNQMVDDRLKKEAKLLFDENVADLDKLAVKYQDLDFEKEKKDLEALSKLLPAFQGSKNAIQRSMIIKEMDRLNRKITYEGFILFNEQKSGSEDLFTPQGLLKYYWSQSTQSPVAPLEPACELPTPNGQKSKLPLSAYLNARTPQFKKWFGDWEMAYETNNYFDCSKYIDEETKEPKIFYHGVRKFVPNFGAFSNMGQGVVRPYGSFEPPTAFPASYFSDKESYANFYAGIAPNMPKPSDDYQPFVYKVFIKAKNPLSLIDLGFEASYKDLIYYVLVAYGMKLSPNKNVLQIIGGDMNKKHPVWVYIRNDVSFLEIAKDYGYDSLIQIGDIPVFDSNGNVIEDRSQYIKEQEFLTFYPNQIKSATVKKSFYFDFFKDIRFNKGGYVRI